MMGGWLQPTHPPCWPSSLPLRNLPPSISAPRKSVAVHKSWLNLGQVSQQSPARVYALAVPSRWQANMPARCTALALSQRAQMMLFLRVRLHWLGLGHTLTSSTGRNVAVAMVLPTPPFTQRLPLLLFLQPLSSLLSLRCSLAGFPSHLSTFESETPVHPAEHTGLI